MTTLRVGRAPPSRPQSDSEKRIQPASSRLSHWHSQFLNRVDTRPVFTFLRPASDCMCHARATTTTYHWIAVLRAGYCAIPLGLPILMADQTCCPEYLAKLAIAILQAESQSYNRQIPCPPTKSCHRPQGRACDEATGKYAPLIVLTSQKTGKEQNKATRKSQIAVISSASSDSSSVGTGDSYGGFVECGRLASHTTDHQQVGW